MAAKKKTQTKKKTAASAKKASAAKTAAKKSAKQPAKKVTKKVTKKAAKKVTKKAPNKAQKKISKASKETARSSAKQVASATPQEFPTPTHARTPGLAPRAQQGDLFAAPRPMRRSSTSRARGRGPHADRPVLLIAGEHSGDLLAGDLIAELRQHGYRDFFGTGGPHMEAAGTELIEHVDNLAIIGFAEVLKAYRRLKALADRLLIMAQERNVAYAVLVDYPGFNLRFAKMLQAVGIRVVFLASPQIWAWKYGRINTIRENVDLMLPLFKFEKEMYDREGVNCEWIGHPLISRIPKRLRSEELLPVAAGKRPVIALVPGSRRSEITRLLPTMLAAVRLLKVKYPKARFLLAGVEERQAPIIEGILEKFPDVQGDIELHYRRSLRIMEACDAMMIASGTATLEGAFFGKPMVLLYRISLLNYMIAPWVIRTRFIGIVNLLARRQVALELIQSEVTPENVAREVERLLEDRPYRMAIEAELDFVRRELGRGNPAVRAARAIVDLPVLQS